MVKKEENSEYPSDVLRVEHIELVVIRNVRPKTQQSQKKITSALKNMKRFRKVVDKSLTLLNFALFCRTILQIKVELLTFCGTSMDVE